jgi:hypothetical protein
MCCEENLLGGVSLLVPRDFPKKKKKKEQLCPNVF